MILSEKFEAALSFAASLHARQVRKGTDIPYVSHLLAVASLVLEHGGDEETAIAALLHDAIEDQGGDPTRQEIRRRFGERVANIVSSCTDAETMPKPPWRERKESYIEHVRHEEDSAVLLVSAADKLHNARSILNDLRNDGESVWERFKGGREGTLWYYNSLVAAFRVRGASPLVEELARTVAELNSLAATHDGAGESATII